MLNGSGSGSEWWKIYDAVDLEAIWLEEEKEPEDVGIEEEEGATSIGDDREVLRVLPALP
jgi:hypothetical protein